MRPREGRGRRAGADVHTKIKGVQSARNPHPLHVPPTRSMADDKSKEAAAAAAAAAAGAGAPAEGGGPEGGSDDEEGSDGGAEGAGDASAAAKAAKNKKKRDKKKAKKKSAWRRVRAACVRCPSAPSSPVDAPRACTRHWRTGLRGPRRSRAARRVHALTVHLPCACAPPTTPLCRRGGRSGGRSTHRG
jgi:hypothetical protein